MTKVSYPRTSPYVDTLQSSWYMGQYRHRSIPRGTQDREIVLDPKYEFRPDKLSRDLYGTEALWWVFMVRNMNVIRDPIWDFRAGTTLWVPSLSHLKSILGV